MFSVNKQGHFVFLHGRTAYEEAKKQARECSFFCLDKDEDEWVTTTVLPSCYNCLFRRWTPASFMCMKSECHEK